MREMTNDEILAMPLDKLNRERIESLTKEQALHLEERINIFIRRGGNMWTTQQRAHLYEAAWRLGQQAAAS